MVVGPLRRDIVLLAVDLLRGTQSNALLGVLGVVVIGVLVNTLRGSQPSRRNTALVLRVACCSSALYACCPLQPRVSSIWMQGWLSRAGCLYSDVGVKSSRLCVVHPTNVA